MTGLARFPELSVSRPPLTGVSSMGGDGLTNTGRTPHQPTEKRMTAWPHARQTQTPGADQHNKHKPRADAYGMSLKHLRSRAVYAAYAKQTPVHVHFIFADDDVTLLSSCAPPNAQDKAASLDCRRDDKKEQSSVAGFARTRGHGPPSDLAANPQQQQCEVCGQEKKLQSVGKGGRTKDAITIWPS
ncbi:hypothetical protein FALCPG4_012887 [Fusarium falciforme]